MPLLVVPESGFTLESSPGGSSKAGSVVPDVFGLTLTDGMIEEMIKCVQNGKPIQLSLGEHPSFSYGTKTQHLASSHDPFTYDLYQSTNSSDSDSSDSEMAPSHFIPKKPALLANMGPRNLLFPSTSKIAVVKPTYRTGVHPKTSGTVAGGDPALAQLTNHNAAIESNKQANTVKFIKDGSLGMPGRKGAPAKGATNKNKFLSQSRLTSDATRSIPSSPSLNASGSPSLGATSVPFSTQQFEQAKAARKPVIHLLAVEPMTEKALREKLPNITKEELKQVLEKVGDRVESNNSKWELNKKYYRELDVWSFDYDPISDRQRAIDNAVRQYDKLRINASEPEWDRLLIKAERGTGKCLSKLQVSIAQGTAGRAPKIKVQKADGSDTPNGEEEDLFGDKTVSKVKGESTTRSTSQPPATKTKKISEKEAQAKRLLSKNPSKAAAKAAPKAAPAKKQAAAPKAGTKVLSSEFVEESDDELPPPAPKPKPKAPMKRPREEEEVETSDSSVPLSKKAKKETPVTNHRVSDASQTSRTTTSSTSSYNSGYNSTKNKNTSPHKSSPLASSPPTNASEFENSSGDRTSSSASPAHPSLKNSHSPIHKRHQKSSSVASSVSSSGSTRLRPEVADLARKFKMYYPKYEVLYKEITAMGASGQRDHSKEKDLLEMHARLEDMKKSIQAGIISESDSQ
ncbi:uncharacterized protein LY89DRAFT_328130 [Mollisia scopiformis]|uniref:Uncharacterized protein n=1 Tax=Mollisia scopiformis TaxID=149040 RepID=A0A132B8Y5_MOLSC|nr:uncharacterized protein LY89DRAFT_328130 [Mollisia scopiformis]KUJ08865.1 hypothetical protein LY89DRAFT_328130 [Mollisia scopiformis]